MALIILIWVILFLILLGFVGYQFIFRPERIVRLEARAFRKFYKEDLRMSNEQLEKMPFDQLNRSLIGSMSQIISDAPEHPERFPGFLLLIRLIGCMIWGIPIFTILFILIAGLQH